MRQVFLVVGHLFWNEMWVLMIVFGKNFCTSAGHYHYVLCSQSMPSIEEATELSSSEIDGDYKEKETLCASGSSLGEKEVSIPALLAVICHKVTKMKDHNSLPPGCLSQQEHTQV